MFVQRTGTTRKRKQSSSSSSSSTAATASVIDGIDSDDNKSDDNNDDDDDDNTDDIDNKNNNDHFIPPPPAMDNKRSYDSDEDEDSKSNRNNRKRTKRKTPPALSRSAHSMTVASAPAYINHKRSRPIQILSSPSPPPIPDESTEETKTPSASSAWSTFTTRVSSSSSSSPPVVSTTIQSGPIRAADLRAEVANDILNNLNLGPGPMSMNEIGNSLRPIDNADDDVWEAVPLNGMGPPQMEKIPFHLHEEEIKARQEAPWCFLCVYTAPTVSAISISNGDYWGGHYHALLDFIRNHRYKMAPLELYLSIQERYNKGCRPNLPDKKDRDRYWSLQQIWEHLFEHDLGYENILETQLYFTFQYQASLVKAGILGQNRSTGQTRIDIRAGNAALKASRELMRYAKELQLYRKGILK